MAQAGAVTYWCGRCTHLHSTATKRGLRHQRWAVKDIMNEPSKSWQEMKPVVQALRTAEEIENELPYEARQIIKRMTVQDCIDLQRYCAEKFSRRTK